MEIYYGNGKTKYGTGVIIDLTGDEIAIAINDYLVKRNVNIDGARTTTVNSQKCRKGKVYVDPSGVVNAYGKIWNGNNQSE